MLPRGPPSLESVPGLVMQARYEQIHADRKRRDQEQVAELQRQTAKRRAEEGFRTYVPPESRMPVSKRLEAWKLLAGSLRSPETGLGPFELALESPEWCFDNCYGPEGRILQKTIACGVIHYACILWLEPGPDGTRFTRLVVGLNNPSSISASPRPPRSPRHGSSSAIGVILVARRPCTMASAAPPKPCIVTA